MLILGCDPFAHCRKVLNGHSTGGNHGDGSDTGSSLPAPDAHSIVSQTHRLGTERNAVQNPFLRYAEEAGWTYLAPEEALNLRRGLTSPVLDTILIEQLQRLNPGVVDHLRAEEIARRLVRVRPSIEGNLEAWEYLKGLKTVFVETEKRERNVRLLDPENLDANRFHVSDEFTFSNGTPPDIRMDIMFFINGVPIVVAETKAATHMDGVGEAAGGHPVLPPARGRNCSA